MKEFKYVVNDELGIHARPAGMIASTAKKFDSEINISFNDKEVKATKIMAVMKLGVKGNDTIRLTFNGNDEKEAFDAVSQLIEKIL
jgi:phosphocarrier protein